MREPIPTYFAYSAAWNEAVDLDRRTRLLDESWAADGTVFDDEWPDGLVGRAALNDYIARSHAEMPGLVIAETDAPQVVGNRLRVPWVVRQAGVERFSGTDFVEFGADGRICRVTMFADATPEPTQPPD